LFFFFFQIALILWIGEYLLWFERYELKLTIHSLSLSPSLFLFSLYRIRIWI
jgi:hypothetical protein